MVLVPEGKVQLAVQNAAIDTTLVKALVRAHLRQGQLKSGEYQTMQDLCDANKVTAKYVQLIDFEWVRSGSSLLDATYFRMNFPTCWCAKALPEEVILELESLYRQTIASKIEANLDDRKYNEIYVSACGFWLLSSMSFALRIMDKDECWSSGPVPIDSLWKQEANLARPRFISRLQAFIQVSKAYDYLPHLRLAAEAMLAKAYEKWDDVRPLDLYPAFQN